MMAADMDVDADGWQLGRDSWRFHRWYFHIYSHPTERGHYAFLLRQLRSKRRPDAIVAGVYQLKMPDGSPILVTGVPGRTAQLHTVLPPDWKIGDSVPWLLNPPRKIAKSEPAPDAAVRKTHPTETGQGAPPPPVLVAKPAPTAAPPVPAKRKPLSLGGQTSDVAATLLEYRRRRWG
jgi:hypothetical protein